MAIKKIKCPKCAYEWKFKGEAKRIQCRKCKKFFANPMQETANPVQETADITSSIMTGEMLNMFKKVKPKNIGDAIPFIIQSPELEVRLVDACRKIKRKPEVVIQMALREWLDRKEKEWKKS